MWRFHFLHTVIYRGVAFFWSLERTPRPEPSEMRPRTGGPAVWQASEQGAAAAAAATARKRGDSEPPGPCARGEGVVPFNYIGKLFISCKIRTIQKKVAYRSYNTRKGGRAYRSPSLRAAASALAVAHTCLR